MGSILVGSVSCTKIGSERGVEMLAGLGETKGVAVVERVSGSKSFSIVVELSIEKSLVFSVSNIGSDKFEIGIPKVSERLTGCSNLSVVDCSGFCSSDMSSKDTNSLKRKRGIVNSIQTIFGRDHKKRN